MAMKNTAVTNTKSAEQTDRDFSTASTLAREFRHMFPKETRDRLDALGGKIDSRRERRQRLVVGIHTDIPSSDEQQRARVAARLGGSMTRLKEKYVTVADRAIAQTGGASPDTSARAPTSAAAPSIQLQA
jgi:hypothetical protein